MTDNTVNLNISFAALLEAVALLDLAEKRTLWEFLQAELCHQETETSADSLQNIEKIQATREDCQVGDYLSLEQHAYQLHQASQHQDL